MSPPAEDFGHEAAMARIECWTMTMGTGKSAAFTFACIIMPFQVFCKAKNAPARLPTVLQDGIERVMTISVPHPHSHVEEYYG